MFLVRHARQDLLQLDIPYAGRYAVAGNGRGGGRCSPTYTSLIPDCEVYATVAKFDEPCFTHCLWHSRSGVPRNFFSRGGSTNSVEDRDDGDLGAVAP